MSVLVSLWISVYCSGGRSKWCRIKPLWFFLIHWLASVCLPPQPFQLPCILPPHSHKYKFGIHIWESARTLAGLKMSHGEICKSASGYIQCESRVLTWLQASYSSSCWWSFLLALVEAAKGIWSPSYKTHRYVTFPFILCLEKLL